MSVETAQMKRLKTEDHTVMLFISITTYLQKCVPFCLVPVIRSHQILSYIRWRFMVRRLHARWLKKMLTHISQWLHSCINIGQTPWIIGIICNLSCEEKKILPPVFDVNVFWFWTCSRLTMGERNFYIIIGVAG